MSTGGAILAIALTAVFTWIGHAVLTHLKRRLEVAKALEANRRELYSRIMGVFFGVLQKTKSGNMNMDEITAEMIEIARDLSVYGSDQVLLEFLELRRLGEAPTEDPIALLEAWGSLVIAMRKDLGHGATRMQPMHIAELIVTDLREQLEKKTPAAE